MSEDNTHRTRQIFYALRVTELTQQAKDMAAVLDKELLSSVPELQNALETCGVVAERMLRSTRKLMD